MLLIADQTFGVPGVGEVRIIWPFERGLLERRHNNWLPGHATSSSSSSSSYRAWLRLGRFSPPDVQAILPPANWTRCDGLCESRAGRLALRCRCVEIRFERQERAVPLVNSLVYHVRGQARGRWTAGQGQARARGRGQKFLRSIRPPSGMRRIPRRERHLRNDAEVPERHAGKPTAIIHRITLNWVARHGFRGLRQALAPRHFGG